MTANFPKRVLWKLARLAGLKRLSWDQQFEAGVWCRGPRSAHTLELVIKLCAGGRLVEFGCGEGDLPHLLPAGAFSEYCGIDISSVAIRIASERAREANLRGCRFDCGDMASWTGLQGLSLVLAEECLYYLSPASAEKFLERCCASLSPNGSILVIVHSATKHARTLSVCRRVCRVREETTLGSRAYLTLAPK